MATEHIEEHAGNHPGPAQYLVIGGILGLLTLAEVGAFFLDIDSALAVSILLTLSFAKFVLVVGYFMHLKFDDRRFMYLFVFPFIVMVSILVALMAMFFTLTR